jgi:hypothetical protein
MEFDTWFDRVESGFSCAGNSVVDTHVLKISDDGREELVKSGSIDLYDMIQSHAESVDINRLIERFSAGDHEALYRRRGVFIDITDMPTNYGAWHKKIHEGMQVFEGLPLEVRREFDFDAGKFFASVGSERFEEVLEKHRQKEVLIDERVVKQMADGTDDRHIEE